MRKVRPSSISTLFGGSGDRNSKRLNSEGPSAFPAHRHTSSLSSVSDSPLSSPTFSFRGNKSVSANSSLASTPPSHDASDLAKGKLPALQEDPMEIGQDGQSATWTAELFERWSQDIAGGRPNTFYEISEEQDTQRDFYSDGESGLHHSVKRRRSGDTSFNSFTTRIGTRFPSFSKRSRERKRASVSILDEQTFQNPSPRMSRSRSRSFRRPSVGNSGELEDQRGPGNIDTIVEDEGRESIAFANPDSFYQDILREDAPNPEARVPTPLLHPLMDSQDKLDVQSPLQSPTVASPSSGPTQSYTPADTPQNSAYPTPPLSTKPSIGSVRRHHVLTPSNEIPAMFITDEQDEWIDKLGHANYQIHPEPYIPDHCDQESCSQLLQDWENARGEYARHLARTQTHFGEASKICKYTEEKWVWIDSQWRRNYDLATKRALENGVILSSQGSTEPAPIAKIPDIDTMITQGKFPQMGDNDIVSPMVQIAAAPVPSSAIQRKPSKKEQILKIFGFQGNRHNRSFSSPPHS